MTARLLALAVTGLAVVGLAGCGSRADLAYPKGASGPATPAGASAPPTPRELVDPSTQSRPKRSDELLKQSEERRSDEFDLPPA